MDAFLQKFLQPFQYLKIQLEEITLATNNFDDHNNRIGVGGFGKVYKGEVSHFNGRSMVAIKRLDPSHGQGIPEFLKEITMLSRYKHENLVSLLGFCCEGGEMILVYELASRGSLDRHLNSSHLSWTQHIKICIDVAKGLSYLHDPRETHQRLIHCDMKSANILIDDQWIAKVSDFGLSIMGPANEQQSIIITLAVGTKGYCDPQYAMTHTLTKESDVYSLGVVLFEVLTGRLCCTYSRNGDVDKRFVPMWIESYKKKNLKDIVFKNPSILPFNQSALEIFSDIAYQCLKESREDRPKMAEIVAELETAFQNQELSEDTRLFYHLEMARSAEPSLNYSSIGQLMQLLSKGVLLNNGKTWFSLNKKGEHCEMRSFVDCVDSGSSEYESEYHTSISRFIGGTYYFKKWNSAVKTHVEAQFLSPGITYTVNLVFKFMLSMKKARKLRHEYIHLIYRLQGEEYKETKRSYLAHGREDGWWMCELYQFISDNKIVLLDILFDGFHKDCMFIEVEGIEFWPLEEVEHEDEKHPYILDSDANWEEKLPTDYKDFMSWSTNPMQWTTKKEAYSIIRKGFLIETLGKKWWFSLDKNGKKCHMLSASYLCMVYHNMLHSPESRFGEVIQCDNDNFLSIDKIITSPQLSSQTTYASYLVYKFPKDQSRLEADPFKVYDENKDYLDPEDYFYLASPETPTIRPKANQNTCNPVNRPRIKGLPQSRKDGWMEVQIWEFQTSATTEMIHMRLQLKRCHPRYLSGLIIEGIDFRPV